MHEVDAARVELVSADLVKRPNAVGEILTERGPFVGVVHCIGMLLPNQLNALASGSGSVPDEGTTYDAITRLTACAAADAAAAHRKGCAFVFISAAEAGWPEDTPLLPPFLRDYLAAKRAVEAHMQGLANAGRVRPVIMRPSLIWTPARPAALPPVAAFTLASMLGVPGVQRPVRVDTLANAVATAIADQRSQGVWKSKDMERAGDQR